MKQKDFASQAGIANSTVSEWKKQKNSIEIARNIFARSAMHSISIRAGMHPKNSSGKIKPSSVTELYAARPMRRYMQRSSSSL